MSILTAENLGVSFGAFDLFRGVTATVANDSKIGLIGPNGVGKTTLLLAMAGIQPATTGRVHLARGRRLGYLRQEAMEAFEDRENSVYAEMLTVFAPVQALQARLNELESRMASGDHGEAVLDEYGRLLEAFESGGGYDYDQRIQQTLTGLGLGKATWEMPLRHLSGGQKTRALLSRLLLEKPDLLMLDEPTNHLDIEAVEWLERALMEWQGAVVIVSHDRYFLDNTANTIWEMSRSGIEIYPGNYSSYLLQRQERWEYYERVFEEEKARLVNEVDFVQRNWVRDSTHARALGMLRKVSRKVAMVETYGIMSLRDGTKWSETGLSSDRPLDVVEAIRRVNALAPELARPPRLRPRLASAGGGGNIVLRLNQATLGYPGNPLFTTGEFELRRGECAALIGPNGSGKTTFIRTLLGQIEPLGGELRLGAGLKTGYFAQAHDGLNGDHSVLEELTGHKEMHPGEARSYLAPYLFQGEDVFKPVSALSGGERARLALAILALDGANFLVLDEPTNHLDIPAQEALEEVLDNFSGTILLVSHDRYLINRLATQIWEIKDKRLQVFAGAYREYVLRSAAPAYKKNGSGAHNGNRSGTRPPVRSAIMPARPLLRGDDFKTRKQLEALSRLEGRIHEQETLVQQLNKRMEQADPRNYARINELSFELARAQVELERLMAEWAEVGAAR